MDLVCLLEDKFVVPTGKTPKVFKPIKEVGEANNVSMMIKRR